MSNEMLKQHAASYTFPHKHNKAFQSCLCNFAGSLSLCTRLPQIKRLGTVHFYDDSIFSFKRLYSLPEFDNVSLQYPLNKSLKNVVKKSKIVYIVGMKVKETQNAVSAGVQRKKRASTIDAKRKEIKHFHYIILNNIILRSNSSIFPRSKEYITQYTP